jgi:hypothetical protein
MAIINMQRCRLDEKGKTKQVIHPCALATAVPKMI